MSGELHTGASDNKLFADWLTVIQEPTLVSQEIIATNFFRKLNKKTKVQP